MFIEDLKLFSLNNAIIILSYFQCPGNFKVVVVDQMSVYEMSIDQLSVNRLSTGGGWMLCDIDEAGWVSSRLQR